ncbi:MAG: helix-turn-helix transcriptional regulator [Saprospiraceae bacterium]|jgi:AraC-like DNA-binding protein|nr:helix-turn-helix transcriptional regulator [Saprospiraceae bacterium]
MKKIKTYKAVHPEKHSLSFDIKKMETIYEKTKGQADEPHRHDYFIILFVKSAKGKHIIDFNEFDLADRQIWFISPGQVHQIIEEQKSYGSAITFSQQFMIENGIDKHFIDDLYLFQNFGFTPPLSLNIQAFENISSLINNIWKDVHSDKKFKYQAIGAWLKLALIECYSLCELGQESNTQKVQASVTLLKNFKSILEKKYQTWHKVNQYAQQLNISSDYLNASIKSLTGKSVKEQIQNRIIVAAKQLLLFSGLTTKEIAYELGFSEPANFSQFFKKCTGISPSKFGK